MSSKVVSDLAFRFAQRRKRSIVGERAEPPRRRLLRDTIFDCPDAVDDA